MSSDILIIEPFFGGSHKQLIDFIQRIVPPDRVLLFTLPAKKWHWRARTSALYFAQNIPRDLCFSTVFCSSVLNLAELVALRPDIAAATKIIYFHENQLVYPVRKQRDRDFQFGYNQILSTLVADHVVFNSKFNRDSFLSGINAHFRTQPDFRPTGLAPSIESKCKVIYFPVSCVPDTSLRQSRPSSKLVTIVWPHRWEHDKNPNTFFAVLRKLKDEGCAFRVSVLGQGFQDNPPVFEQAREEFSSHILHWGFLQDKDDYYRALGESDVAVSTADHEFFGVSMMEATMYGCYPLLPNRLVYPELFPKECLYATEVQLLKRLRTFCKRPDLAKQWRQELDVHCYTEENLVDQYLDLFSEAVKPSLEKASN